MQRFAGIPYFCAGALWALLLYTHRGAVYAYHIPASSIFIVAIGVCVVLGAFDLRRSLRTVRDGFDEGCLALAAVPGGLLIVAYVLGRAGLGGPGFLRAADWGMLLVFPGTMLAGSPLVRHRILWPWIQVPALIGLALPAGQAARMSGHPEVGLGFATTLGIGWVILGAACRSAGGVSRTSSRPT